MIIASASMISNSFAQKMYFDEKKSVKCKDLNNKEFVVSKVKVTANSNEMFYVYNAGICSFSESFKKYDLNIGADNYLNRENLAVKDNSGIWLFFKISGYGDQDYTKFKDVTYNFCIGSEENFYSALDKNIISKLEQNIKNALNDKYVAKMPITVYNDQYGISGIYYLSKPSIGTEIIKSVNFEFNVESEKLKIHFDERYPALETALHFKNSKKMKYFSFIGGSWSNTPVFNTTLYPIEKDLYFLRSASSKWKIDMENCSNIDFNDLDSSSFIIGKNKDRIEQISKDKELYTKLVNQALEKYCVAYNQDIAFQYASKYPFPEPGMKDANVVTAATQGIKQQAAIAKWNEKIEYCYIKSQDWTVYKDKITGEIQYRTLRLIAVMSEGKECKWEEFSVKQDYVSGSWGKTTYNGNTQLIIPIECSEAMKYK